MMTRLLNQMKMQASLQDDFTPSMLGRVSSYDPNNYACKITLFPDDPVSGDKAVTSGWIPVGTIWVGNGWGLYCPPSVGDLVEVDFQEGDFDAGQVHWRFYNDGQRPLTCPSGEFWIVHKSGSSIKLTNDGRISVTAPEIDLNGTVICLNGYTGGFLDGLGNLIPVIGGIIVGGPS